MNSAVLDASAILAVLHGERGSDVVMGIERAIVSAVNLSEVVAKLADIGLTDDEIRAAIARLDFERVANFGAEQAFAAGVLRRATRRFGLSLGDRACLALGTELSLPVVTADAVWERFDTGPKVKLIRRRQR